MSKDDPELDMSMDEYQLLLSDPEGYAKNVDGE